MHFQRRWKKSLKLVRPNCTLKLRHTVLVPEKSLPTGFFTEANISVLISGNPQRGNEMLQALGFGDWLTREIHFNSLKIALLGFWGHAAKPRWAPLPPSVCSWLGCPAYHHPAPQNQCFLNRATFLPSTQDLSAHVALVRNKLEGHSRRAWRTRRKQPLILCGLGRIRSGRHRTGTAVELGVETVWSQRWQPLRWPWKRPCINLIRTSRQNTWVQPNIWMFPTFACSPSRRDSLHCAGLQFDPQKSCWEGVPLYSHSLLSSTPINKLWGHDWVIQVYQALVQSTYYLEYSGGGFGLIWRALESDTKTGTLKCHQDLQIFHNAVLRICTCCFPVKQRTWSRAVPSFPHILCLHVSHISAGHCALG